MKILVFVLLCLLNAAVANASEFDYSRVFRETGTYSEGEVGYFDYSIYILEVEFGGEHDHGISCGVREPCIKLLVAPTATGSNVANSNGRIYALLFRFARLLDSTAEPALHPAETGRMNTAFKYLEVVDGVYEFAGYLTEATVHGQKHRYLSKDNPPMFLGAFASMLKPSGYLALDSGNEKIHFVLVQDGMRYAITQRLIHMVR